MVISKSSFSICQSLTDNTQPSKCPHDCYLWIFSFTIVALSGTSSLLINSVSDWTFHLEVIVCEVAREHNMSHAVLINTHSVHFWMIFKFSELKKNPSDVFLFFLRDNSFFSLKKEIFVWGFVEVRILTRFLKAINIISWRFITEPAVCALSDWIVTFKRQFWWGGS